ncbi:sulfite oxidase [soil metagenome]
MAKSFGKHDSFLVRAAAPFNGGPAPKCIAAAFITPIEQFFVRAHADVPAVDAASFSLDVGGLVRSPLKLSLSELRSKFASHRIAATLQCAGNRRDQLIAIAPVPGEVPWGAEAISTAEWEGIRLRDLLDAAGVNASPGGSDDAGHVEFVGHDQISKVGKTFGFGGSIPLDKARGDEVLIAWSMNGQPLPAIHGFPLRVIVPGFIGARSVKWLEQINVLAAPSENFFQAHAYKLFAPEVRAEAADWKTGVMLGDFPVSSAITSPELGATLVAGETTIRGWAIAGGGRTIERVEVSVDDGQHWLPARFTDARVDRWTWRIWECGAALSPGTHFIACRAFDSAGAAQPADARERWNFKGYLNNAWHRVSVVVVAPVK